jgi:TolA-binding protein
VTRVGTFLFAGFLLQTGCVLDRTGQSITSTAQREMAIQTSRVSEAQRLSTNLESRVQDMEEVLRYRGRQEAEKLENLDQVTGEIRRLRGELELLQHASQQEGSAGSVFREDAAHRLAWTEGRLEALEAVLGMAPPPMPVVEPGAAEATEASVPPTEGEATEAVPDGADLFELGKSHLADGRARAARAVLDRFLQEAGDDARVGEARLRFAETWFEEGLYQQAILKLEDVVQGDTESEWVAWAMVRQGECFQQMDRTEEAELFWEDVLARHPDTEAANGARKLLNR